MASLQERNGSYRVLFSYHGKLHAFTIGKVTKDEADGKAAQVDYLLMRLKQKLLIVPEGTDIVTFMEHDGKPPTGGPTIPSAPRKTVTLDDLKTRYLATHANGTIEANSLDTCKLHLNHFCRVLGDGFPLADLSHAKLQEYIDKRALKKLSPATIRKEVASLRAAWNWGSPMGLTIGAFASKGLRYPKSDEKPPFMTMAEIQRRLDSGAERSLWDCLYLQPTELAQMLAHVKAKATHAWLFPLVSFAVYTGARRSEILRAEVNDLDFEGGTILVHEKKRSRSQRTTRRIPMAPVLREALQEWLKEHPGGNALFCHTGAVARSKKRSLTTGHQNEKNRPKSLRGRQATIRARGQIAIGELTRNEVHDHLKRVLAGSKWAVLRGLHALRHSFISTCASRGIDQRLIDQWSGHSTEEQRKRYRHLFPDLQQEAITRAFA